MAVEHCWSLDGGHRSLVEAPRWWTLFRVQVASRGWPVVERAVGVVADEWLRGFVSSMEGAATTRRAVKTPVVSRETPGVLRIRDVSRETIGDCASGVDNRSHRRGGSRMRWWEM